MPITFFWESFHPSDWSSNATSTITLTPPASMQSGDLVVMQWFAKNNWTISISEAWWQTRTTLSAHTSWTVQAMRMFRCVFNWTWSANPIISLTATGGTSASMLVFRPSITWSDRAVNNAISNSNYANITSSPYTVTVTGVTTTQPSTVALATRSDRVWTITWSSLSGTWRDKTWLISEYNNTSWLCITHAYQIKTTAWATNDVSQNRSASWSWTIWMRSIISFYEIAPETATGNFIPFFM